eukprot:TRINITY_DN1314_c0_g1_i5.p1 TRINITY_DN1314_c0_g1~~TRINITY_DN1314_c0_g1_i5.p1  ORF type:complete len:244 (+),score=96.38 TRINITY_DN1314_c0_g1_i5:89-733(+)
MLRSLVGSEMCIRDSPRGGRGFGGRGARYGDGMPQANDNPRPRPTEVLRNHEVTVEISPPELVGVLMAHDCRRLLSIHLKYGTSNDKIDKERDGGGMSVSMVLYGPTEEAVQAAKEEVMREVGIFKKERQDERFQYGLHELQHNLKSVATICAANTRNQGCLLYTSDAADEEDSVDLGGRRIIKKKKKKNNKNNINMNSKYKYTVVNSCAKNNY